MRIVIVFDMEGWTSDRTVEWITERSATRWEGLAHGQTLSEA